MHDCWQSNSIHLLFPVPFVKMAGNRRAEKGIALVNFPNRVAYNVSASLFEQKARRAGVGGLLDIRLIVVGRKDEHFGGRDGFENLASGLQTIKHRHGDVHQNQSRAKILDQIDCLKAVYRLADHFQIVFEF